MFKDQLQTDPVFPNPMSGTKAFQGKTTMRCRMCGGVMEARITNLPFKVGNFSIVILKAIPVLQCRQCGEAELEHQTMLRVDQLLSTVDNRQNSK